MLKISRLFIYPIKSLRGIPVDSAIVTDRGLKNDRRWMIVDENNHFLTLREVPKMTLLNVIIKDDGLKIDSFEFLGNSLFVPFVTDEESLENVVIWNASVKAKRMGKYFDDWFSEMLGKNCRLVYMPERSLRPVDTTSGFAPEGKFTSFADAYPFMMLGEASMDDLNGRMKKPVLINRFRPNIVFSGGFPYQEDSMVDFKINGVGFTGLENCTRCMIPNIDTEKGEFDNDREPLKTLFTYRVKNGKVQFGRNLVHKGEGIISVGDEIQLENL